MVGHCSNWNADSYYKNDIGDGFVFCAYSFTPDFFNQKKILKQNSDAILSNSFIDLQFFGKKESGNIDKGKLSTYEFHPAAISNLLEVTNIYIINAIKRGIDFQISLGLKNIIIPNYYENDNINNLLGTIRTINNWLKKNKKDDIKYFMSIPITNHTIIDAKKIDDILYCLTDIDILFDGYYIVCESKPETRRKLSVDYKYLKNLSRVFEVLKKQKFITIYAYANWDAIVFLATTDIDYITIASFENLRNFNIKRFTQTEDGGPSKGWYFSEKILNMVKAQLLDLVRAQNGIDIIRNEKNIFSDNILNPAFNWSNQNPDVHKNYLLSIDRLLKQIANIKDLKIRKQFVLDKILEAIKNYEILEEKKIFFPDPESKNYHLHIWESYLRSK